MISSQFKKISPRCRFPRICWAWNLSLCLQGSINVWFLVLFRWKGASECWRSSRPAAWRVYWTLSGVYSPHKHIETTSTAKQALNELHPFTPAGTRPNIWTMRLPPSRSKTCCSKINPTWNWKAAGRSQCLVRISKELLNKPLSNISVIIVLNCHFEKKLFLLLRIFFKKREKRT